MLQPPAHTLEHKPHVLAGNFVYGVLLVVVVLFFPQGAVPWLRRLLGRARP